MDSMKKILNDNIKLIVGIIIGAVISGAGVYAVSVASSSVTYDNTNSGSSATTVKAALDELYTKAKNCKKIKDNTVYFAFGEPTASSTTDYTTLGKKVFVAKNGDQKSVCIIRNSRLHCFDNNNYAIEKEHMQQVFSDISCNVYSSYMLCIASDFDCYVGSNGYVDCRDLSTDEGCYMDSNGPVYCS